MDTEKNLNVCISMRIFDQQIDKIDKIVYENPEKYLDRSHFIRCAIMQLINKEKKKK